MSADSGKPYGLILHRKGSNQDVIQRPSIFEEGSDSEDSTEKDWVKKPYQCGGIKSVDKKQTKIQMQKALNQDPSIYQYDEIYDEIKDKVNSYAPKKGEKKQSRYIQSLKRNAERRKLENERRLERQVQKERQQEGGEFKDKEMFVTSSYKKKLEEFQKMDEEEKRIDELEGIGDVLKQKDISGFYRHLYKSTVDTEGLPQQKEQQEFKEKLEENAECVSNLSPSKKYSKPIDIDKIVKRQYRKRTKSGSSREEGEKTTSSSSSSSSSSSESEDNLLSKSKKKGKEDKSRITETFCDKKKRSKVQDEISVESSLKSVEVLDGIKKKKSDITTDQDKIKGETKKESVNDTKNVQDHRPIINIWLKRTVGTNFDDALRRYLERKSKQ